MGRPRNAGRQSPSSWSLSPSALARTTATSRQSDDDVRRLSIGQVLRETYDDIFVRTDQWPRSAFVASLRGYLQENALELEQAVLTTREEAEQRTTCGPEVYGVMVPVIVREVLNTVRIRFSSLGQGGGDDDIEATRPRYLPIALIRDRGHFGDQQQQRPTTDAAGIDMGRDRQRQLVKTWCGFHPLACIFDESSDFSIDADEDMRSSTNRPGPSVHPAARTLMLAEALMLEEGKQEKEQAHQLLEQSHRLFDAGLTYGDERDLPACQAAVLLAWHHLTHISARRGIAYFALACQLLPRHNSASPAVAATVSLLEAILSTITVWAFSQLDRSTSHMFLRDSRLQTAQHLTSKSQGPWWCTSQVAALASLVFERHPETKSALPSTTKGSSLADVCASLYEQLSSSSSTSSSSKETEEASAHRGDVFHAAVGCARTFTMLCLIFPRSSPPQPGFGRRAIEASEGFVAVIKALEDERRSPRRASNHLVFSRLPHHTARPAEEASPLMNMTQDEAAMLAIIVTMHLKVCLSSLDIIGLDDGGDFYADSSLASRLLSVATSLASIAHSPWLSSDNEEINTVRCGLDEAVARLSSLSISSTQSSHSDAASTLASLDVEEFVPAWPLMAPSFLETYAFQALDTGEKQDTTTVEWLKPLWGSIMAAPGYEEEEPQ